MLEHHIHLGQDPHFLEVSKFMQPENSEKCRELSRKDIMNNNNKKKLGHLESHKFYAL